MTLPTAPRRLPLLRPDPLGTLTEVLFPDLLGSTGAILLSIDMAFFLAISAILALRRRGLSGREESPEGILLTPSPGVVFVSVASCAILALRRRGLSGREESREGALLVSSPGVVLVSVAGLAVTEGDALGAEELATISSGLALCLLDTGSLLNELRRRLCDWGISEEEIDGAPWTESDCLSPKVCVSTCS